MRMVRTDTVRSEEATVVTVPGATGLTREGEGNFDGPIWPMPTTRKPDRSGKCARGVENLGFAGLRAEDRC